MPDTDQQAGTWYIGPPIEEAPAPYTIVVTARTPSGLGIAIMFVDHMTVTPDSEDARSLADQRVGQCLAWLNGRVPGPMPPFGFVMFATDLPGTSRSYTEDGQCPSEATVREIQEVAQLLVEIWPEWSGIRIAEKIPPAQHICEARILPAHGEG